MVVCTINYGDAMNIIIHSKTLCSSATYAALRDHTVVTSVRRETDKLYNYEICVTCWIKTYKSCYTTIDGIFTRGCVTYLDFMFHSDSRRELEGVKYNILKPFNTLKNRVEYKMVMNTELMTYIHGLVYNNYEETKDEIEHLTFAHKEGDNRRYIDEWKTLYSGLKTILIFDLYGMGGSQAIKTYTKTFGDN